MPPMVFFQLEKQFEFRRIFSPLPPPLHSLQTSSRHRCNPPASSSDTPLPSIFNRKPTAPATRSDASSLFPPPKQKKKIRNIHQDPFFLREQTRESIFSAEIGAIRALACFFPYFSRKRHSEFRRTGRPIFTQCRYWEELRSLYEVSRLHSTG